MESRQDRHRKPKKERIANKKTPLKAIGGLTLAAAACFAIGIGASYWTSNSKSAEEQDSASTPVASVSPVPTKTTTASTASAEPSAKPSPESTAKAVIPTPAPIASSNPTSSGGQVKLTFVGDVLMASKVEDILKQKGYDYPYTNVKDFLSTPDYTIANLETPITLEGQFKVRITSIVLHQWRYLP